MPKAKHPKIGYVRLSPRRLAGRWLAIYRYPETGQRVQLTIKAQSQSDAEQQAKVINREILAKRVGQGRVVNDDLTVGQAFERTISGSGGNLTTRGGYTSAVNLFLRWLGVNYPAARVWSSVKTDMVRSYVMHCHRELKLSRPGVRSRLLVIKMASRYWMQNEPDKYRDFAAPVKLPKDETNPLARAERERAKALSAADARALLEFLRERRPDLYGPAMLQTLCGLRVLDPSSTVRFWKFFCVSDVQSRN